MQINKAGSYHQTTYINNLFSLQGFRADLNNAVLEDTHISDGIEFGFRVDHPAACQYNVILAIGLGLGQIEYETGNKKKEE
jgi:hypothetical protein